MKTFTMLLTLSLLAVASAVSAANYAVQPAPASFAGTWKTIAGGTNQYTVILKQIGKKVTGSYTPGNGKILDGVVSDDKLTFKWTQDGGFEGTAVFTMDEDRKGFTGSSSAVKPREFTVTWSTYKPVVSSFAGTWETITNSQHHFALTMVQTGAKVTGVYPRGNGKIEGTVSGRVLRFKWQSDGGTGSGRLVMDESGKAFSGTYNRGNNPDDVENTWNGKLPEASPDKAPPVADKVPEAGDKAPDGPKPLEKAMPPNFFGVWHALLGDASLELILQQIGNHVTGRVKMNSAEVGVIREGLVTGNVLRFKIVRPGRTLSNGANVPDEFLGNGELVMDAGGKSFTGTVLGTATSGGTFVGR
jgi:hypothetical protein